MARLTVTQIMQSIAATVNQEATAPTTGGAEYSLWLEYINRSVHEWAEANDWEVLRKTYFPAVSGTSGATLSLPLDYRKLAGPVINYSDSNYQGIGGAEITDIPFEQRVLRGPTDNYVYETGDSSSGKSLVFNPATLSSGASIAIPYFSIPTSLASPAEIPVVPDSQFIIDRTISYIFEARSDPRFQQQEVKAREKLLQMIEMQNDQKFNSYAGQSYVQNGPLSRRGFRIGRD